MTVSSPELAVFQGSILHFWGDKATIRISRPGSSIDFSQGQGQQLPKKENHVIIIQPCETGTEAGTGTRNISNRGVMIDLQTPRSSTRTQRMDRRNAWLERRGENITGS
jgi:hypothetical protein